LGLNSSRILVYCGLAILNSEKHPSNGKSTRLNSHSFIRCICLALLVLSSTGVSRGQSTQSTTDPEALRQIATAFRKDLIRDVGLPSGAAAAGKTSDSTGVTLQSLGLLGGRPLIYSTHNFKASATVGANQLNSGGASGLNLNGAGKVAGLWDAGNVLTTHRELTGRASQRDTTADGATHATHVAGTMAAMGAWSIVRGMAPEALVDSYNWIDDVPEMALAAADGLRLSNHSYGVPLGWTPNFQGDGLWGWMGDPSISDRVDFRFGWYDELSAKWDAIAVAAPFYLMIKSAGNEREQQGPRDGEPHHVFNHGWEISTAVRDPDNSKNGYDTIGDAGLAKNVLTVGASESAPWGVQSPTDVIMTSFSSWGPTDDGRIKPDIVAPGVMLMSAKAASDEDYGPSSGTSMAAPVVAGSALLLQEIYEREFGSAPLSSTIKGLIVHTAHESGLAEGPDYQFGWGLLNAEKAALHLNQASISSKSAAPIEPFAAKVIESSLAANADQEFIVTVREAGLFRATLAWIDPAAEVGEAALDDPTLKLVHDLDLRVTGPDGEHYPWVLDPSNPSRAAARAENRRDNVEQVLFNAQPGEYVVRVISPPALTTAEQSFSLLIGEAESAHIQVASISGQVVQKELGIHNVKVQIQGPKWTWFTTLKDGVFHFSDLEPGSYTIIPEDPILTFSPASVDVVLPGNPGRIVFEAEPPVELLRTELFESPRLLNSNEYEVSKPVVSAAAGGVYGLTFAFYSAKAHLIDGLTLQLDTEFDGRVMPFSGVKGNQMQELNRDWTLSAVDATHVSKRVPAIWFDGGAQVPFDAKLPYTIRTQSDQIIFADTLSIRVDRPDDMAPIPYPWFHLPGFNYAPPGKEMEVRVSYLDGSAIQNVTALMLDRDNESVILHSIPLRDTGNIEGDFDVVAGDGLFSAKFTPRAEADYRLAIWAKDVAGNETTFISDAYYSSVPFATTGDLLFWSTYEQGSRTKAHEAVFKSLELEFSWWDELTRGQIKENQVSAFDLLVWGRHDAPIKNKSDMTLAAAHVAGGGSLVILGQNPVNDASRDWMTSTFGVHFEKRIGSGRNVLGTNELKGFSSTLEPSAAPFAIRATGDARPLLVSGSDVLAVQIGRVVISTVTAASLPAGFDQEDLLSRLLFQASGHQDLVPQPGVLEFDQVANMQLESESVTLSWPKSLFSNYEIQVAAEPSFASLFATDIVETNQFEVTGLRRGTQYFARVRSTTAKGEGNWSPTLSFFSRPSNQPPFSIATEEDLIVLLSRNVAPLDVPLSHLFSEPEGDALRYEVEVFPSGVFTAYVEDSKLIFSGLKPGTAFAKLSAFDSENAWAAITLSVTVKPNIPPVYTGVEVFESSLYMGTTTDRRFLDSFSDAEGDSLTYSVRVLDPSILDVQLGRGVAHLTPLAPGTATYIVEASDGFEGGTASFSEIVTVIQNQPPVVLAPPQPNDFLLGAQIALPLAPLFQDPEGEGVAFSLLRDELGTASIRNDSLFVTMDKLGHFVVEVAGTDPRLDSTPLSLEFTVKDQAALTLTLEDAPQDFSIASIYPMPFSGRTTFEIHIPGSGSLDLSIYNMNGQRVATVVQQEVNAGVFELTWDARALPAGVYFYRASWYVREIRGTLVKLN
jgi:subtilisin family serine protease